MTPVNRTALLYDMFTEDLVEHLMQGLQVLHERMSESEDEQQCSSRYGKQWIRTEEGK